MPPIERLDYAGLKLYLNCAEAWRRRYLAHEPTTRKGEQVVATALRETVINYIVAKPEYGPTPDWPYAWTRAQYGGGINWGADTPERHYNDGLRVLGHPAVVQTLDQVTVSRESQVKRYLEVALPTVPVPISVTVDLITDDGVPVIIEVDERSWNTERAANSLQSLLYLAALEQAAIEHSWWVRHLVIVMTREPKVQILEHKHTADELAFLYETIERVWRGIVHEVFPLNPTSWRCAPRYCDYWTNCRGRYV